MFFAKKSFFHPVLYLVMVGMVLFGSAKKVYAKEPSNTEKPDIFISVVGLADFYSPNIDSKDSSIASLSSDTKMGWGGGVLLQGRFVSPLAVETGLLFLHRQHRVQSNVLDYTESSQGLLLPVGLKMILADLLHIGGGGYLYHRFGDLKQDFSVGSLTTSHFNAGASERWELGFYLSAGLLIPVHESWGILVDARYLRGVTQLSKDRNVEIQSADWILIAGAQFRY